MYVVAWANGSFINSRDSVKTYSVEAKVNGPVIGIPKQVYSSILCYQGQALVLWPETQQTYGITSIVRFVSLVHIHQKLSRMFLSYVDLS